MDILLIEEENEVKAPEKLKEVLEKIHNLNHKIAITTYSAYPEIVALTLKSIGLSEEILNNIEIVFGRPEGIRPNIDGKNLHIKEALRKFNIDENSKKVILIDDTVINTKLAKILGYQTIEATPTSSDYLQELDSFIDDISKNNSLLNEFSVPDETINSPYEKKEIDKKELTIEKNEVVDLKLDQNDKICYYDSLSGEIEHKEDF